MTETMSRQLAGPAKVPPPAAQPLAAARADLEAALARIRADIQSTEAKLEATRAAAGEQAFTSRLAGSQSTEGKLDRTIAALAEQLSALRRAHDIGAARLDEVADRERRGKLELLAREFDRRLGVLRKAAAEADAAAAVMRRALKEISDTADGVASASAVFAPTEAYGTLLTTLRRRNLAALEHWPDTLVKDASAQLDVALEAAANSLRRMAQAPVATARPEGVAA